MRSLRGLSARLFVAPTPLLTTALSGRLNVKFIANNNVENISYMAQIGTKRYSGGTLTRRRAFSTSSPINFDEKSADFTPVVRLSSLP